MSRLVIDGITYIRSRDARRIVHVAPVNVCRLARARDIKGRLIESLWSVNLNSPIIGGK